MKERSEAIRSVRDRAEQERLEFFQDSQRVAYCTVPVKDHRESHPIRSRDFRLWVMQSLFDSIGSAPRTLVAEILESFETRAICRGPMRKVFVRVGEQGGATYVDLANDQWQVVELTTDGWQILDDSPVKFRRTMGMRALPYPSKGKLHELLCFLNLQTRADEILVLSWLAFALRAKGPYPILLLSGVKGSGKSTMARVLRELVDPSEAALTTMPRSERDLAVAATNGHLISMDNLSEITAQLSDAMCRVSTGGSFRTRKLYTDNDELLLSFESPIILNGIEELATRPDLLDRAILVHTTRLENKFGDRERFWQEFEEAKRGIFAGLLDVLCSGMGNVETIDVPALPRMADFARFGVAIEQVLGFAPGEFLTAYTENITRAGDVGLEASPIFATLRDLVRRNGFFSGTAGQLLEELTFCASDVAKRDPSWPKAANKLSGQIARIEPELAHSGIRVRRGRNHNGRFLVLECVERESSAGDEHGRSENGPSRIKPILVNAAGA
jgi:hypothetical protein